MRCRSTTPTGPPSPSRCSCSPVSTTSASVGTRARRRTSPRSGRGTSPRPAGRGQPTPELPDHQTVSRPSSSAICPCVSFAIRARVLFTKTPSREVQTLAASHFKRLRAGPGNLGVALPVDEQRERLQALLEPILAADRRPVRDRRDGRAQEHGRRPGRVRRTPERPPGHHDVRQLHPPHGAARWPAARVPARTRAPFRGSTSTVTRAGLRVAGRRWPGERCRHRARARRCRGGLRLLLPGRPSVLACWNAWPRCPLGRPVAGGDHRLALAPPVIGPPPVPRRTSLVRSRPAAGSSSRLVGTGTPSARYRSSRCRS